MRKIKELEERIAKLEGQLFDMTSKYFSMANDFNLAQKKLNEQEEFLKKTVAPFIANSLDEELDKSLTKLNDAQDELFKVEPKKKENKKTDTKKTSKIKTKKESK